MATDVGLSLAPDFIQFLFSTKPKFDCHFVVGNKNQGNPERIGAVKLMLMAHSEVFRLQLEDSDLKEKGDVPVEDVHPDSFKGMLKYVYGHDTTPDMCFDEADNLLYVAEKYMIQTLKDKLAVRLMKLLNPDNLCSLLNNPACYTHLELNSAITQILRFETDRVLASPQFLLTNAVGFLKILEQDGLAVPEIELWRAAMKWAKHRANSDDGQLLRQQISGLTKHMRLCTLTGDEIFEVIPSGVLSYEEIGVVCMSIGKKEKPQGLNDFSNETEPRKSLLRNEVKSEMKLPGIWDAQRSANYNFTILTKQQAIELLPLVCWSIECDSMSSENGTYRVDCTITVTQVVNPHDPDSSSTNEPTKTASYSEKVKFEVDFEIPLAVDGKNIILLPDTKYTVNMKLNGYHSSYLGRGSGTYTNDDMTLTITCIDGIYLFPSDKMQYRVKTVA